MEHLIQATITLLIQITVVNGFYTEPFLKTGKSLESIIR